MKMSPSIKNWDRRAMGIAARAVERKECVAALAATISHFIEENATSNDGERESPNETFIYIGKWPPAVVRRVTLLGILHRAE
jgi:hypothetical protein